MNQLKALCLQLFGYLRQPKISGPIGAAVLSFLGYQLTPLKPLIRNYLYPPHMHAEVIRNYPIQQGDHFEVQVHLLADPANGVLPVGQVLVTPADQTIRPDGESLTYDIFGSDANRVIPLKFIAQATGASALEVQFVANHHVYASQNLPIGVASPTGNCTPPLGPDPVIGCWKIAWDKWLGYVRLENSLDGYLGGTYTLTNDDDQKETGQLKGFEMNRVVNFHSLDKKFTAYLFIASDPSGAITLCGNPTDAPNNSEALPGNASAAPICQGATIHAQSPKIQAPGS